MNIEKLVLDLCSYDDEQEWFEFKENWFQPEVLGEYVSALSNAAAFHYKAQAYFGYCKVAYEKQEPKKSAPLEP